MIDQLNTTNNSEQIKALKTWVATVYLCQAFTFMLAGLPLLLGVVINFIKKEAVQNTWLQSHCDWQIKTAWVSIAGFALSGLTFEIGLGFFVLIATVTWLVYRISIGWYALNDSKPVQAEK